VEIDSHCHSTAIGRKRPALEEQRSRSSRWPMSAIPNETVRATERDARTASTGNTGAQSEEVCSISSGFVVPVLAWEDMKPHIDESCHRVKPADSAANTLNSIPRAPWTEPDWSQFRPPASVPSKLTILFVGVDNGSAKDPDLKSKEEYNNFEQAYREHPISHCKPTDIFKTTKSDPHLMEITKTEGLIYVDSWFFQQK